MNNYWFIRVNEGASRMSCMYTWTSMQPSYRDSQVDVAIPAGPVAISTETWI